MYTIFTIWGTWSQHDHGDNSVQGDIIWPPYKLECTACGQICVFADETSYTCTETVPDALNLKMSENFKRIFEFLTSNGLKLNEEKTHLLA